MFNSIQQFEEIGIKKLEKVVESFIKDPTDMASFVYGIQEEVTELGLNLIKETLENCNQMLRDSGRRKLEWNVVRTDTKTLTTSLGSLQFEKTLFKNKSTGEEAYLLDRILGMKPHERITEDAEAKLLEEAVQTSYRKAGEEVNRTDTVSKQTVKRKLHRLEFPEKKVPIKKKSVDYLYIDADEDHVSLQFKEQKGDLTIGENNRKNNCVLAKLVYVYEGIEKESPKSKRHRLLHPHYFSGVYDGLENGELWDEVYRYLDSHYDLANVKKIYLNADGGGWIQSGKSVIAGITSVLDEFHLKQHLIKMTSHLLEKSEEVRKELTQSIKEGTKEEFGGLVSQIVEQAEKETTRKRIGESASYLLSNWSAAKLRLANRRTVKGCSAEAHVSHVLSSRMSSRPMGWSRLGADKMAHLRAYYWNGGDMLELVRSQKDRQPIAAGAESNPILSCDEILRSEKNRNAELGKYVEGISHSLSGEAKKFVWFNAHISGL